MAMVVFIFLWLIIGLIVHSVKCIMKRKVSPDNVCPELRAIEAAKGKSR